MDTLDKDNLIVYGLNGIASSVTDIHDFLDILLKMMLEERGITMDQKIDIATFIETNPSLFSSITDVEMIFSAMKNTFSINTRDEYFQLQGQCLNVMTAILIQAIHLFQEQEVIGLFSEHLNFLWKMVKQVNNEKTFYVRSVAANCLTEIELSFPKLLDSCLDSLYTATVMETSIAHQQYLCLLVLAIKNSLFCSDYEPSKKVVDHMVLKKQVLQTIGGSESASALYISFPNINQVVSFVLDQLPFCSDVAVVWLIKQLTFLLQNSTNSLPLLQPFVLSTVNTKNLPMLQLLCNLEKSFGEDVFSAHSKENLMKQLVLNSLNSSFSVAHRLMCLDLFGSFLDRKSIESIIQILPSCFDGPETQLKKIYLLIDFVGDKHESIQIIIPIIESLRKQTSLLKTIKMKSSLTKALYKCVVELKSNYINEKVASMLITAIDEDLSYIPFVLCFVSKVRQNISSSLPTKILDMLLLNFTQPTGDVSEVELRQYMPVFWSIVKQGEETGQAKIILVFFMKHILSTEISLKLSWDLGHEILSFCQYLMKEYNTTEFYHELCETLELFTLRCVDIDLQDRAHIYFSLLTHLSAKVLKNQKKRYAHSITPESSFYPNPTICRWDKPIFRLAKCSDMKYKSVAAGSIAYKGDLNEYYSQISELSAKNGFKIPCYLHFNQESSKNIHIVTAAAIQFKVNASWGTIKDSLVGHLNKKIAREQKCGYSVSVQCFPRLPHPVTVQVSAEFGFEDNCYTCSMDPFKIEFSDCFFLLPVEDHKKELFGKLWEKFERSGCVSVNILPFSKGTVKNYLDAQLKNFIVSKTEDEENICVGIFLHPAYHLLAQFFIEEEDTTLKIATEDTYVISLGSSFFKTLGNVYADQAAPES